MTKERKSSKKDKKAKKAKHKNSVALIMPNNASSKKPKFIPHFTDSEDEKDQISTVKAESEAIRP